MRYLILLALIPLIAFQTEKTTDNSIAWDSNRKLTWTDFRCSPDPNSLYASVTDWAISCIYNYTAHGFQVDVKCTFDKNASWTRSNSAYILKHEQGHFDIAEVFARKLRKEIAQAQFDPQTASLVINKLYDNVTKECINEQDQYDDETEHSVNEEKQKEWEIKIAADLQTLDKYRLNNASVSRK